MAALLLTVAAVLGLVIVANATGVASVGFVVTTIGPDPRKVDTSGSGPFDPAGLITHDPNTYAP